MMSSTPECLVHTCTETPGNEGDRGGLDMDHVSQIGLWNETTKNTFKETEGTCMCICEIGVNLYTMKQLENFLINSPEKLTCCRVRITKTTDDVGS